MNGLLNAVDIERQKQQKLVEAQRIRKERLEAVKNVTPTDIIDISSSDDDTQLPLNNPPSPQNCVGRFDGSGGECDLILFLDVSSFKPYAQSMVVTMDC